MKLHITAENLKELSFEQQNRLRELWNPIAGEHFLYSDRFEGIVKEFRDGRVYDYVDPIYQEGYVEYDDSDKMDCLPLLSIGKMIALIDPKEETIFTMMKYIASEPQIYKVSVDGAEYFGDTMCGCLWEAVKSIYLRIDTKEDLVEKERQEKLSYIRHCQKCFKVFNLKDHDFSGGKKCPHCGAEF